MNLKFIGGGKGIRTPDIQLAKLALYQLSYAPDLVTLPLIKQGSISRSGHRFGLAKTELCGLFYYSDPKALSDLEEFHRMSIQLRMGLAIDLYHCRAVTLAP